MRFTRTPTPAKTTTCARFGGIAAEFGKLVFKFGGSHIVVFAGVGVRVNCVARLHRLPHSGVPHQYDVEHAHVFERKLVLPQFSDALALVDGHAAAARFEIAAEDLHEGGLAAAIGADQPIAIAPAEFDRDVFEEGLAPELHGDVCGADHGK